MNDWVLPEGRDWNAPALGAFAGAVLFHRDADLADVVAHCRGRLVYLATPYSKIAVDDGAWHPALSLVAGSDAAKWAGVLAVEGVSAVSPIVQAVQMVERDCLDLLDPLDARFWENWCRPLLDASEVVVVPPIPGWDESEGIWYEVRTALTASKRVYLIKPEAGL